MDIKQSLTYRSDEYVEYNNLGNTKYNYKKHGINIVKNIKNMELQKRI